MTSDPTYFGPRSRDSKLRNAILGAGGRFSRRARRRRGDLFRALLGLDNGDGRTVVDVGGGTGDHATAIVPDSSRIIIADLCAHDLARARDEHGLRGVLIDGVALPFADQSIDVVFCSSVIEHVTGPGAAVETDKNAFRQSAVICQSAFAAEIRRVARSYFVQTPSRWFPIESHSWLPAVVVALPRSVLIDLLRRLEAFWPKHTDADWHLLTARDLRQLFPDAEIIRERVGGITKSVIAVKRPGGPPTSFVS